MAAGLEAPNQLQEALGVFKRRFWTILLTVLYATTIGTAVAFFLPKKYEVKIQVNVLEARVDEPGRLNSNTQQTSTQRELQNAKLHVTNPNRIAQVIEELGWQDYQMRTPIERADYVDRVIKNLEVEVQPKLKDQGSTFIDITYKDTDPNRAETFLNALAPLWLEDVSKADIRNMEKARTEMRGLMEEEDFIYKAKKAAITEIQKNNGITPVQPGSQGPRYSSDPVEERLKEAESRLADLQAQAAGARAELEGVTEAWQLEPATRTEEVPAAVDNLAKQMLALKQVESKYEKEMSGLKEGVSTAWRRLEQKLESVHEQMRELEDEAQQLEATFETVPNPAKQKLALERSLLEQRLKGLDEQINITAAQVKSLQVDQWRRTDAMSELQDLEYQAQAAREKSAGHSAQLAEIEENLAIMLAYGTPYVVTQNALADDKPSSPNIPLIITICALAGLALGIALSALLEFSRPGFRNPADAVRSLSVPVLGVVDRIVTNTERTRARIQRVLVAVSTIVLLGGLVWVTWAWHRDPQMLGTDLAHALDELHETLK